MNENLRKELCQIVNDDTCKFCEFWDRQGHYCFILTIHKDTKKCLLMDKIFALLSQYGVVQLDENQELPYNLGGNRPRQKAMRDMLATNFKRVRPLVEEK